MKVLLCADVKKIGYYGDVVDVADGFARNYLFPQGLAKVATDDNIRSVADEKAKRSEHRLRERKRLEAAAAAVKGAEVALSAKANELGHLFGSVGAKEIAENLRSQGFDVLDEFVHFPEHIKQVGKHEVTLKYADDLQVNVTVVVVAEGAVAEASQETTSPPAPAESPAEGQQPSGQA
jgi:large subunit ribosomal protein L9